MFQNILVSIDFSEDSYYALKHGIRLAEKFNSTLFILYVNHDESMLFHYLSEEEYEKIKEKALQEAKKQLEKLIEKFPELNNIDCHYNVRRGVPYVEIIEEIESKPIDLVIIGSHGRTGAKKFFFGGTAEKVARRARTNIMITRRK